MRVRVPGDKSLSQRALILSALAEGTSRVSGLLHGGDTESTAGALRALGAEIPPLPTDGSAIEIGGVGLDGLRTPNDTLDLGNSGTGTRLLMGALAGSAVSATLDGDASLRTRPMARVTRPLGLMGARFDALGAPDRLPLTVHGRARLEALDWDSPVASAQVKSAILLAGLTGQAFTLVTEPRESRDHTERMLNSVGASVISHATEGGWRVEMRDPPRRIRPLDFDVPGDISSAAFVLALAALGATHGEVVVESVGLNPTRTAFLDVLMRMGTDVEVHDRTPQGSMEPVGDVIVRAEPLRSTAVGADEVPRLIDELPLVAVLGACAEGETRITGAEELRAKESDRIATVAANLRALGVDVEELPDGLIVQGRPGRTLSGPVRAMHDHRIAMAFSILGAATGNGIDVDDRRVAGVSFPGFDHLMSTLTGTR